MKTTCLIFFFFLSITLYAGNSKVDTLQVAKATAWLQNQPLVFIENKGQFTDADGKPADDVLFKTSFGNCNIYITTKGLSYVFFKYEKKQNKSQKINENVSNFDRKVLEPEKISYYRLDMNLEGSTIEKADIVKEEESKQGTDNYFYAHCPKGIYGVQAYGKITIKNIYKGIDWVLYTHVNSKENPLTYDFVVHPQADYKDIKIKFVNAKSTQLTDNNTKLKIQTIAGNIEEGNLYSYQKNGNENQSVKTSYVVNKDSLLEFELGAFDRTKTLIIDPLVWATYYGVSNSPRSICVDSKNNIYISGLTSSLVFPIQQLTGAYWQDSNAGGNDIYLIKFNNQGVRQWSTYYGGTTSEDNSTIGIDSQDNIYISGTGYLKDFPTQQRPGAYWQATSGGASDIFILMFNSQGIRQWATLYGGSEDDYATSLFVDSHDCVHITGSTYSTNLPTQTLTGAYNQSTNAGSKDIFILKFDNHGIRQWATYYGGSKDDVPQSIRKDSQGNFYLTGDVSSTDLPLQQLAGAYNQLFNAGQVNAFILKFNDKGIRQWATYYGGDNRDFGKSICFDSQDNLYITGTAYSKSFPTLPLTGAYNQSKLIWGVDLFILKFNNQGLRQWATCYGGSGIDEAYSICSDNQNNIYITGKTESNDFPTQQLPGEYWQSENAGFSEAFLLLFNNQGVKQWATYYGGTTHESGVAVAVDKQNFVYFIGVALSNVYTIDYGNGAYYDNSLTQGEFATFILKIKTCNIQKPISVTSNRNDICIYDKGNIVLTASGGTGDTLKWYYGGCGLNYIGKNSPILLPVPAQTTTYYARWESACDTSTCDSIVIQMNTVLTKDQYPIICQGETFAAGINNYAATGIYTDALISSWGCDSIVTTHLTVNPMKSFTQNPVICQGDSFSVGSHNYTATGTYTDVLKTYLGCDSTVTTHLIVNLRKMTSQNPVICQGVIFTVGKHDYVSTGTYSDTLATVEGCDSVVTTNLIVHPIKQTNLNPIICEGDSFHVGTHDYSSSGIYTDILKTFLGCDSTITTNLIVGVIKQATLNPVLCEGESFPVGSQNYTITGTYNDVLKTYLGCDSTITTNLIVIPIKVTIQNPVICQGGIVTVGINDYTTAGSYSDILTAFSGCDSIVTTNLTVNPLPIVSLGSDMNMCPGDSIVISPGQGFIRYLWSDGTELNHLKVPGPGNYGVTASDGLCSASDDIIIKACASDIRIPNAFTPDNDGLNDRFFPVIPESLRSFQMIIFNKWGQQLYRSNDASEGWDGTFNREPCPTGVYTYMIECLRETEPPSIKLTKKWGIVTILR